MEYLLKGICGSMNWVRYRSGSVRLNFRKPLDALPSHARAETNLNRHRRAKEPAQSSREEILAVRQRSCVEKIGVHPIATSRSHERAAQSDPLRYRARNGRHQRCAPQPSERRGDRLPAPMDRMSFHTCPKSPASAVVSRASMLATWDNSQHWCGSRRRDRFECPLVVAG